MVLLFDLLHIVIPDRRPFINLPSKVAEHVFSFIKLLHRKSDSKKLDPSVSIYKLASCTRTFSCLAAQKHIKYLPVVSQKVVFFTLDFLYKFSSLSYYNL